jgi:hypothetical protein
MGKVATMKFNAVLLAACLIAVDDLHAAQIGWPAELASKRNQLSLKQAAGLFERFGRLRLPANAREVSRTLGDSTWMSRAWIYQQIWLAGWIPIEHSLSPPGGVFAIRLTPPLAFNDGGYTIYVHTSADFPREKGSDASRAFRRFLIGIAPRGVNIDEYALCYPDGRILHVLPNSRKMMPSIY